MVLWCITVCIYGALLIAATVWCITRVYNSWCYGVSQSVQMVYCWWPLCVGVLQGSTTHGVMVYHSLYRWCTVDGLYRVVYYKGLQLMVLWCITVYRWCTVDGSYSVVYYKGLQLMVLWCITVCIYGALLMASTGWCITRVYNSWCYGVLISVLNPVTNKLVKYPT